MALPLRPRAIPQCSACIRSYAFGQTAAEQVPAIGAAGLGQQTRGKKKMVNTSSTVPVRLLKNVKTFGKRGSIVPISTGRMRNEWFPRRIAEYITLPEIRTLRASNTSIDRNFDYDPSPAATEKAVSSAGANRAWQNDIPGDIHSAFASMRMRQAPEMQKPSPERSMQLLEIFVPGRLDFYREAIPEEQPAAKEAEPEQKVRPQRGGAAADLFAARMQQPVAEKSKASQAIYGSVSTQDILVAVRAAMGTNDEAARVQVSEDDLTFVESGAAEMEEAGRIKHVGDYTVEIKVKGAEEGIRRLIKVHAQEV